MPAAFCRFQVRSKIQCCNELCALLSFSVTHLQTIVSVHGKNEVNARDNQARATMAKMKEGELVTFRSAELAWNIDGSSSDQLVEGSWIKHWENLTGLQRGVCSYRDCRNLAEHGGHVWIKHRGVCLTPICATCNSPRNVDRMQHKNGRHSKLRANLTVLGMTYTADMQHSDRRIAVKRKRARRVCEVCDDDISDRPASHAMCLLCYCARRVCVVCDDDISDRPTSHAMCLSCYRAR